jgi:Flp pilus assembly protein TadB
MNECDKGKNQQRKTEKQNMKRKETGTPQKRAKLKRKSRANGTQNETNKANRDEAKVKAVNCRFPYY